MARQLVSPPLLLGGAALVAAGGALAADITSSQHLAHSTALGAVAAVVLTTLRRLGRGVVAAFPAVSAAPRLLHTPWPYREIVRNNTCDLHSTYWTQFSNTRHWTGSIKIEDTT